MNFYYPINLNLTGKRVTVIGGGKIAERRIQSLLRTGAEIKMVSPKVTDELKRLASKNDIYWVKKEFSPEDIKGACLVIAATNDKQTNLCVKEMAEDYQLVGLVDDPIQSDFQIPSVLRRGKLSIAISTSGASPILAKKIREKLEVDFDEKYEDYLEFLSECRNIILEKVKEPAKKKKLLTSIVSPIFFENNNREEEFQTLLREVLKD